MRAAQVGFNTVLVSWTPPPAPPSGGYRITVEAVNGVAASYTATSQSSSYNVTVGGAGVYSVELVGLSQHFPSHTVGPVTVTAGLWLIQPLVCVHNKLIQVLPQV